MGELLAKLGLTPHKPLQRTYQRDPEAVDRWRRETFPAIARQAKAEGGEVFFLELPGGYRARQDLGTEGANADHRTAGAATVDQRGVGGERQWSLLE